MDKAFIVIAALLLNLLLGGIAPMLAPQGLKRLFAMPTAFLRDMERKLNRDHRSEQERTRRGFLLVAVMVCIALFKGWVLGALLPGSLQAVLLACLLPLYSSYNRISRIRHALQGGNVPQAREALAGTLFRHHAVLDAHGCARAGIEYAAVQFSEKLISPIFWYMALGLPAAFASMAVSVLQEALSGPAATPAPFGKAAHQAQLLLHYIPSRIAAVLWLLAALVLPEVKWKALVQRIQASMGSASPNRLALECAAHSLFLSLGGPTSAYVNDSWVGLGTAMAMPNDVRRAQRLFLCLGLLMFLGLALCM